MFFRIEWNRNAESSFFLRTSIIFLECDSCGTITGKRFHLLGCQFTKTELMDFRGRHILSLVRVLPGANPSPSTGGYSIVSLIGWNNTRYTHLLSKLTQMLPKNAKMTCSWLAVGGTLIRSLAFCSHCRFLVARIYNALVHLKKFLTL